MRVFVTSTLLQDESHLLDVMADLCAVKAAIVDDDWHDEAPRYNHAALFRRPIAFIFFQRDIRDWRLLKNEIHTGRFNFQRLSFGREGTYGMVPVGR